MMYKPLVLERDDSLRKRLFGETVMTHPAKMNLHQLCHYLTIFHVRGGFLLDPFGGSGTAMLAAGAQYGMYVATVDLAPHFVEMQRRAWDTFSRSFEMLDSDRCGDYLAIQGDSRALGATLASLDGYDEDTFADLIITSPPYADAFSGQSRGKSIVAAAACGTTGKSVVSRHSQFNQPNRYDANHNNIGNLKGTDYLQSMAQVWRECAHVLRHGGYLICVTRDCVRDQAIVPIGKQNHDLIVSAGLSFVRCDDWQIPQQSFWRILYSKKFPDAPTISTEQVWIFRKQVA
jgi:16S rRNA G966 N2-methylase RsmD